MSSVVSRTLRNVTNVPQQIVIPDGVSSISLQYVDSGVAGCLRVLTEFASQADAAHRLTQANAHLVVPSGARLPAMSVIGATSIYLRTDNAVGAGNNTLNILMEIK